MAKKYKLNIRFLGLFLIISSLTIAQIPNAGFENWTGNNCGAFQYYDADGWGDMNSLTCNGDQFTANRQAGVTHVHSGNFALFLNSRNIAGTVLPGICATGVINLPVQSVQGGFPIAYRPTMLNGWYQYAPVNTDTFSITINLFSGATSGTIIGSGSFSGSAADSNYTEFSVQINYTSSAIPDSAQITILSSQWSSGQAGTKMWVDDLGLVNCAGFADSFNVTNATCSTATGSATLATPLNGTRPYTYVWSNSATTGFIQNVVAETYFVTITDSNGCTVKDTVTVSSGNTPFNLAFTTTPTSCTSNTGSIVVNPSGGTSPYNYLWSTGSTSNPVTGLGAGSYPVTVTDSHGCTALGLDTIFQPGSLTVTIAVVNASFSSASDGQASVAIAGGTGAYSILWNTQAASDTIAHLSPGNYCVTVSDVNNCSDSACDSVGFGPTGIEDFEQSSFKVYPNPANDLLIIATGPNKNGFSFNIYTLTGQLVEEKYLAGAKSTVPVNQLTEGMYLYQLKDIGPGNITYGKLQILR
jgi:hypothetical protein